MQRHGESLLARTICFLQRIFQPKNDTNLDQLLNGLLPLLGLGSRLILVCVEKAR
tara:strand:+ start:653 stop:817 length:165 start_codon:yes stop_codon:yes gene_type:complete